MEMFNENLDILIILPRPQMLKRSIHSSCITGNVLVTSWYLGLTACDIKQVNTLFIMTNSNFCTRTATLIF